jgi:CRISPR system Cascade subunit CasE
MYLSKLSLDPRSRQVVSELNNRYQLHRTVMSAFDPEEPGRVLYRLEQPRARPPHLLVQSPGPPDWSHVAGERYLRAPPECKEFTPAFHGGQRLLFRLRANPTVKREGSRLGLLEDEDQRHWLERKGKANGFDPLDFRNTPEGFLRMERDSRTLTFYSVLYEGILQVHYPQEFLAALRSGLGPAKGFGFGLLSAAAVRRLQ